MLRPYMTHKYAMIPTPSTAERKRTVMPQHVDLILTGARVCPIDAPPFANGAVAITGERILAVGPAAAIRDLGGPRTRVVCLAPEQAILPAFHDSHQHLLAYVRNRQRLELWQTRSVAQVLDAVADYAATRPPGSWLVAVGHDQGRLAEQRHPTLAELDAAAPDHPLVIYRACLHMLLANSRALALTGIDISTPNPDGGIIERADGRLTGVLHESAMPLLTRTIVEPPVDWERGIPAAAHEYHRRGITAVGEAALGHVDGLADLTRIQAAQAGGMRLRIYGMAYHALADRLLAGDPALLALAIQHGGGDDWLRLGAIKIFADGTLGAGTAWLSQDYVDEPGNRGGMVIAREALDERVLAAHRAGFQVAIHAIGDATVEAAISAYERALDRHPRSDHRHRIEHIEVGRPDLAARMAARGIIGGIQTNFTYWEQGDLIRVPTALADWGHPWGGLQRAGVRLADGSDNPVLPDFAPLHGIGCAVTRRTAAGALFSPAQALRIEDALAAATLGSAYAAFAEDALGSLTPGKLADLVVLGADPHVIEPEEIGTIPVQITMAGGEIL